MAIDKLSIHDPFIDNIPAGPPLEVTHKKEPIDLQQPDLTCTSNPIKTKAHRQGVGVEHAWGKAYGKATGLHNKHQKYSEQWDLSYPFWSAHDFQQAQSFRAEKKP